MHREQREVLFQSPIAIIMSQLQRRWPTAIFLEFAGPDRGESGRSTLSSERDKQGAYSPAWTEVEPGLHRLKETLG